MHYATPIRSPKDTGVVKCIRLLPGAGQWAEITLGLWQQVSGLQGYAPFTYRGLVGS